ncbi:MAG TPA: twin-arginine translocase subunit TatC [Bacteroidota bacterium]|nr:twin-arginine translocase subunit TatC [Bacteroidota bacterium]
MAFFKATNFDPRDMSFLDHLEELRWRIIKAVGALVVVAIVAGFFADFLVQDVLLGPLRTVHLKVQVLTPYGIMLLYMEVVLFAALIGAMPVILYQLWAFIAPGLMPNERQYASRIVFFTSVCFLGGVAFGYFILVPTALAFFAGFGTQSIELNIAADRYISFILSMILGAGLVFELPMVTFFLAKFGIVTPAFMRKYRRHAIILILIVAAVVTPTPDIITQSLLAGPMYLLYELSIFIAAVAQKKPAPPVHEP